MHPVKTTLSRLPFVDCARGYAILMVITCHLTYCYPDLPYPLRRITVSGWYGVQLFFLASCYTLLRSWHAELSRYGQVNVAGFLLRRFFRIAPAYYAAAGLYAVLEPPGEALDLGQAAVWLSFLNVWTPDWMATTRGSWMVVPGGWSVGVEFAFYALFPLFVAWATSLRRAGVVALACIVVGALANRVVAGVLADRYAAPEIGNFLYFWPPNQLSVFALGGVVFFLLSGARAGRPSWVERYGPAIGWLSAAGFVASLYLPRGHYLGDWPVLPEHLGAAVPLAGLFVGLASGRGWLVNRPAAAMGRVSFSAYLLHFAILKLVPFMPSGFGGAVAAYDAVPGFALGWIVVVGVTYGLSSVTFACIEAPMLQVGKRLAERVRLPGIRSGSVVAVRPAGKTSSVS